MSDFKFDTDTGLCWHAEN